jgi:hypothetical protein
MSLLNVENQADIQCLGIITSGRPQCFGRCLITYASNVRQYGQTIRFYVIDGTADLQLRRYNEDQVQRIRDKRIELCYMGPEEKTWFAKELIAYGLEPDLVNFALFDPLGLGRPTGANRNAFLLATVGELALSVDDDTCCALTASPDAANGLAVTTKFDPTSVWFFASREDLMNTVRFSDISFIALHSRALGRNIADLGSRLVTLDNESERTKNADKTCESKSGVVLLTQTGVAGDCGCSSNSWYLAAEGSTRTRLLDSEASYNSVLASRKLLRVVDKLTVTSSPFLMAYAIGLDNRSGLVPFFPVQRNQDGIFGMIARVCFPDSFTCHVPYAVEHDPPQERQFESDEVWKSAGRVRISDMVAWSIESFRYDLPVRSPNSRLQKLGEHLAHLGSLPDEEFCDQMREAGIRTWRRGLLDAERLCEEHSDGPTFWLRDMRRWIQTRRRALLSDSLLSPIDLVPCTSSVETRTVGQELIRRYGELLKYWPHFISTARSLKAAGKAFYRSES